MSIFPTRACGDRIARRAPCSDQLERLRPPRGWDKGRERSCVFRSRRSEALTLPQVTDLWVFIDFLVASLQTVHVSCYTRSAPAHFLRLCCVYSAPTPFLHLALPVLCMHLFCTFSTYSRLSPHPHLVSPAHLPYALVLRFTLLDPPHVI